MHDLREVGPGFWPGADFPVGVYAGPKPGSLKGRPTRSAALPRVCRSPLLASAGRDAAPGCIEREFLKACPAELAVFLFLAPVLFGFGLLFVSLFRRGLRMRGGHAGLLRSRVEG